MNRKIKNILTVTIVFLSSLLLALPQSAIARDGRGGRGGGRSVSGSRQQGSRSGRSRRSGRGFGGSGRRHRSRRGFGRSSLGLSFGFSDSYYSTSSRQWVPGYFQTHSEQVLVEPGHYEMQTQHVMVAPERHEIRQIPAVEETRHDEQGKAYKVIVSPARTQTVVIPAKYEQIQVKVWLPNRYETRQFRTWVPGRWISYRATSPGRSWFSIGGRIRF